jgi:hypothetical protein
MQTGCAAASGLTRDLRTDRHWGTRCSCTQKDSCPRGGSCAPQQRPYYQLGCTLAPGTEEKLGTQPAWGFRRASEADSAKKNMALSLPP